MKLLKNPITLLTLAMLVFAATAIYCLFGAQGYVFISTLQLIGVVTLTIAAVLAVITAILFIDKTK